MKLLLLVSAAAWAAFSQTPAATPTPRVVAASGNEIGGDVTVKVENLAQWGKDLKTLRLYLDGREIYGLEPFLASRTDGVLKYELKMRNVEDAATLNRAAKAGWVNAFRHASGLRGRRVAVAASVGEAGSLSPFPSTASITLKMPFTWFTWLIVTIMALLLVATIWLGKRSDLLRDTIDEQPPAGRRWSFSLGRCQMAAWFILVVGAYLYLYAVTETAPVITANVLALIGISAATGFSSFLVDSSKRAADGEKRRTLYSERVSLAARIDELSALLTPAAPAIPVGGGAAVAPAVAVAANAAALQTELQEKQGRLKKVEADIQVLPPSPPLPLSSGNLFEDLLSDDEGISFHRFQMFVWTIVLGVIFVRSVLQDYVMPEFDTTLLGLMGISSGTYIGFKIPDQPKPAPKAP